MSTEVAPSSTQLERVLIDGDLKALSPEDRVRYYQQLCASLGLNPLSKPFAYIVLNGKLQLYALRDCAEQLRKIHGVSVRDMTTELIGDVYVVRATFQDKTGRTDQATGAVPIKGLSGENLANAYLKAETKCKRRGTLSICGLGMLDETETETIKGAVKVEGDEPSPGLPPMPQRLSARAPAPTPEPPPVDVTPLARELEASLNFARVGSSPFDLQDDTAPLSAPELKSLNAVLWKETKAHKPSADTHDREKVRTHVKAWLARTLNVEHLADVPTGKLALVRRALPDLVREVLG